MINPVREDLLRIRSHVSPVTNKVYAEELCYVVLDICGSFQNPTEPAVAVRLLNLDYSEKEPGVSVPVRRSQLRPYFYI